MADQKISALPTLATLAAVDEVAIVDVSGADTRKISSKSLIQQGVALIDAGSIPSSALASLGANSVVTASITDANVTNAKLEHSSFSLGGLTISLGSTDSTPSFDLTDATNYPTSSLTGTITNAQLAGSIANNKLANSSISLAGVSINLGDTNATPIFDLTNATNYPASSLTGTVSNAQLAGSIANSKLVNSSIVIGGVTLNLGDSDSSPAFDLSDATNYPTSSLSGTITNAQLAGSIQGSKILAASISSTELGANSVTAVELANLSVDTAALIDSSVTDVKISGVSGTKITAGSLPATALNTSNLGTGLAISSNNLVIDNTVAAGTAAKVTFSSVGLVTGSASLAASDLPIADATNVGGVSIPAGSGLAITAAGALSLSNSITATTVSGVSVDSRGLISSITALVSSDIPTATTSNKGGVIVQSGGGISVDASGNITTTTSGVSAGTYQSVVVTSKGIITSGSSLTDAEIPNISAAKLTSGTIDAGRFAANSIGRDKFSDTSTTIFGSVSQSGYPTASYAGEFFFDSVEEDLFIWDSNAWQPVTTLTKGSLKLGGVYNASNSTVSSVTSHGSSVGLTVGQNLPTPSSTTDATYLIVGTGGTPSGIPNGPTGELIPPDYLLSVTSSTGSSWVEIDLSTTVSSPTASNVSVISGYGGSSVNVQNALAEIYTDFLKVGGGNVTGELKIENTGSLAWEGTANDYEIRLTVVDPTSADRTITLPDASGTVVLQGQTGVIDSTMISDGAIMNADINANALISISKLEALTGAQIIIGNSSNEPVAVAVTGDISIDNTGLTAIGAAKIVNSMVSGSAAIAGSKITPASTSASGTVQLNDSTNSTSTSEAATANALKTAYDLANQAQTTANAALPSTGGTVTNNVLVSNAKSLRLGELTSNGNNWVGLRAPDSLTTDTTFTLMSGLGSANQIIKTDASGNLSFTNDIPGSSASCTGNAATATILTTARAINGVNFDGSADITVTAAAGTLTGATLNSGVTASSLTSVGTLTGLAVTASTKTLEVNSAGTKVSGNSGVGNLHIGNGGLTIATTNYNHTNFTPGGDIGFNFANTSSGKFQVTGSGGWTVARFTKEQAELWAVTGGGSGHKIIANTNTTGFNINEQLQLSDSDGSHHVGFVAPSTVSSNVIWTLPDADATSSGQVLSSNGSGTLSWSSISSNSATATALQTARAINGVNFDGTADITVTAAAGTLTGTTLKSTVVTSSLTTVGTLGSLAVTNNVTIGGDLTVNGTTTSVNSTQLDVTDKNITMGNVSSPSDTTADGGGLTLKGSSDKTFNWVNSTDAWTSSEHIALASGKTFIGNGSTLTALNASNLSSGTVPDARFPSTLPAASGANLTNVNATTLDSIDSGSFLRGDVDDTTTGHINFNRSNDEKFALSGSTNPLIRFNEGSTNKAYIQWHQDGYLRIVNEEDGSIFGVRDNLVFSQDNGSTYKTIWHSGNDGVGSGLDADLLDGKHDTSFLRSDAGGGAGSYGADSDITFNGGAGAVTIGANSDIRFTNGTWTGEVAGKIQQNSNNLYIQGGSGGVIFRDDGGTNRWQVTGSGHWRPGQDSTYNIGESGVRVATIYADTVEDSIGDLRRIIKNAKTSAYTLVASDAGKCIPNTTGGWTINNNVFSDGDAITLYNNSGSDQTITRGSGTTMYHAADGDTSTTRTLGTRGMATIYVLNTGEFIISGSGLS